MKDYAIKSRKSHALRFWMVTLLCAGMIGAACWIAYTQTARKLRVQLETTVGEIHEMPATNPPYTKSTQMPVTTPPATERVQPQTEKPDVTRPVETLAAAAPVSTETVTQTVTEAEPEPEAPPLCVPVAGEILHPYSNGELVKSPTTGVWQTHNGIDIAAALGEDVCAMSDGVVSLVEQDALWGVTVTLDHRNGFLTRYCGLNAQLAVSQGDTVQCGTPIGTIGNTADAESDEPSHLHFEVIRDGSYIDPERLLAEIE